MQTLDKRATAYSAQRLAILAAYAAAEAAGTVEAIELYEFDREPGALFARHNGAATFVGYVVDAPEVQ